MQTIIEDGSPDPITGLLNRITETWSTYQSDELSDLEATALTLLVAAGMVERRFEIRLRMINHPVVMTAKATITGEAGLAEALAPLVAAVWQEWREPFEQWKQGETRDTPPFHCQRVGLDEWRLTGDGVQARTDLANGDTRTVLDFVLARGFFTLRPSSPGSGRLLSFDKVQAGDQAAVPAGVQVTNWAEGAHAFAQAFENLLQSRRQEEIVEKASGLPRGPGSGAIFKERLAEYLENRRETYHQLVRDTLNRVEGAAVQFEDLFGPTAIARTWLRDAGIKDDDDRELNRVKKAIVGLALYQTEIQPVLQEPPQRPSGWRPPERKGESLDPLIARLLDGNGTT